jgi:hypothetical protein
MSNIPSITDFGASSGAADNTSAIQAAFNSGPEIYVPAGSYKTQPLNVPASLKKLWSSNGSFVGIGSPTWGSALLSVSDHGLMQPVMIEGLGFDLSSTAYNGVDAINSGNSSPQLRGLNFLGGRCAVNSNGSSAFLFEDSFVFGFTQSALKTRHRRPRLLAGDRGCSPASRRNPRSHCPIRQ